MKKYFFLFIGLSVLGSLYIALSDDNTKEIVEEINPLHKEGFDTLIIDNLSPGNTNWVSPYTATSLNQNNFITLKKKQFSLNGNPFHPIVLNYITSIMISENKIWASPYKGYNPAAEFVSKNKTESHNKLLNSFNLIKEQGFNTVRIVGVGEPSIGDDDLLSISTFTTDSQGERLSLKNDSVINLYLNAIEEVFKIAEKAGLKTIFLIRIRPESFATEYLLAKFCEKFKDNTNILAIDIFNEPLYFDKPDKSKEEVFHIVNRWKKIIETYAPNHLVTIGLAGMREVFRWDPNILDVDFISYHPYEYEPEQVRNEIYWYGKYTSLPWIIGETAIPADNDSITYEEQLNFAKNTLDQTFNCGGSGYSWWQYQDVDWKKYHANFMGILNWHGQSTTLAGEPVFGTIKPVAKAFKNYEIAPDPKDCICFDNYYNYSNSAAFKVIGKVVDENNSPIEGAVILAWNEGWSHSYHTVTKKDGSFELLGSYPFYHWMASATSKKTIRADIKPEEAKLIKNYPTIDLEELELNDLEFLK